MKIFTIVLHFSDIVIKAISCLAFGQGLEIASFQEMEAKLPAIISLGNLDFTFL